ncbi:MAG: tyrosine-protein phosphatase [Chloroflexi bacterium]|nr:tyrosine-protein phosphatase [Chloroflexota bacterium]
MAKNSVQQPNIRSIPNLRDLGGHVARDGRRVRSGLLYRSEQLGYITDAEMPTFAKLGLKKIYDLRTADERAELSDRVPDGAVDVVVDVLADQSGAGPAQLLHLLAEPQHANAQLGGGKIAQKFIESYRHFISLPSARAGFARMFTELADDANLPALFHCTTGKDRTGWAAAALLSLWGVPDETVMQEYLLSNEFIMPEYQPTIDKYIAMGIEEEEILLSILGVRQEYLEASLQEMRDQYGNIETYFSAGLGIDSTMQDALRERFLVVDRF